MRFLTNFVQCKLPNMKTMSKLLLAVTVFALLSFTLNDNHNKTTNLSGKYGAFCDNTESTEISSMLLTLNDDMTFQYIDNSFSTSKVNVTGKWSIYEGDVYLSDYKSEVRIPRIWKTDKDEKCLKARKGTMFLRLCRQG